MIRSRRRRWRSSWTWSHVRSRCGSRTAEPGKQNKATPWWFI